MFDSTFSKFMIILVILVLSVSVSGMCLYNQSYVIEGLANPNRRVVPKNYFAELGSEIKNLNDTKTDSLLPGKYKGEIESLIVNLYDNTQLEILENLNLYSNSLVDEKSKNKRTQYLDKILKLNELNNTLDTSMKYVNKM